MPPSAADEALRAAPITNDARPFPTTVPLSNRWPALWPDDPAVLVPGCDRAPFALASPTPLELCLYWRRDGSVVLAPHATTKAAWTKTMKEVFGPVWTHTVAPLWGIPLAQGGSVWAHVLDADRLGRSGVSARDPKDAARTWIGCAVHDVHAALASRPVGALDMRPLQQAVRALAFVIVLHRSGLPFAQGEYAALHALHDDLRHHADRLARLRSTAQKDPPPTGALSAARWATIATWPIDVRNAIDRAVLQETVSTPASEPPPRRRAL